MSDRSPDDAAPAATDPTSSGYMVMLPFVAPISMTVTEIVTAMLPWRAPSALAMLGTADEDGEPALSVAMEWPLSWLRTTEPLPKFEHEALLLRRFSSDQALMAGRHAYGDIQPGADPPDATAMTDAGRIGVESTALTVEGRRGAHHLFFELRRRVQEQEPAAFSKLAGHTIYVWFDEDNSPVGRPHRRSDEAAITALIEALANYEPQTEQLLQSGGFPDTAPELPLRKTNAGATFYAVPITAAAPSTLLFSLAGFELGLAYTTLITAHGAWDEVQRLVDSHDKPGVDLLVITAGGPDVRGNTFPSEELLARFVASNPLGLNEPPKHIKRVVMHSWGTGGAVMLYPDVAQLFPDPYSSLAPPHHPFAQPPTEATEPANS